MQTKKKQNSFFQNFIHKFQNGFTITQLIGRIMPNMSCFIINFVCYINALGFSTTDKIFHILKKISIQFKYQNENFIAHLVGYQTIHFRVYKHLGGVVLLVHQMHVRVHHRLCQSQYIRLDFLGKNIDLLVNEFINIVKSVMYILIKLKGSTVKYRVSQLGSSYQKFFKMLQPPLYHCHLSNY